PLRIPMRFQQPTGIPCEETTGFLFKHACSNAATCQCDSCSRKVCDSHAVVAQASTYCMACARKMNATPRWGQWNDPYDPYWYSAWFYPSYGYYGRGHWGHSYNQGQPIGDTLSDPND